jgi:error-prone DNA polymerase
LQQLSRQTRLPLVAANDVHYHTPARLPLHDVLTAIRHGVPVAQAEGRLFSNSQRHLRPIAEIREAFDADLAAIRRTIEVADRCAFSLEELRYEYPEELVPPGFTPDQYLAQLTWEGAARRYPGGVPDKVRKLIEHELALIRELRYEAFFLTVHDLVRFAREREILCQGRGSAANSAVCYCLGVTSVDPDRIDVLFERFISRERAEAPDIDVDFEHEEREQVLQYLYEKYGRDRAGLAATVITYCGRSAVRDVGKALGLSPDRVNAVRKQVEGYGRGQPPADACAGAGIDPASSLGRRLMYFVNEIMGFPRHLSQHVGGMVITQGPLCELVPIENAAMPGRSVVQWDKDDLEALGILKVDVLALGMLTAIRKCFGLIKRHYDRPLDLATVPAEDKAVYDMCCEADTIGVFQIESRAQMSMLPRLKPRSFYDLVIEVSIVRPGPIQGQMVHPYLRRRRGEEEPFYPNEAIREVLGKTLGVPLFQEQAMQLAVVAAGFTPGEADQLRRAMAAWRKRGVIDQFRPKLIEGMKARGLSEEFAERVYQQIRGFGEYGFPESHAASFALLAYISAWLKCHYQAAFTAALLNSQPMGFYAPAQLVWDARRHRVRVLPVDVNYSEYDCTLEVKNGADGLMRCPCPDRVRHPGSVALRLGFRLVSGLREAAAGAIVAARADGPFTSMPQFTRRTRLTRPDLERLADADAFGSLALGRREALWHSLAQSRAPAPMPLFEAVEETGDCPALPALSPYEQVIADYRATGLSLKGHPLAFFRKQLDLLQVLPAECLATHSDGRRVKVAGIVLLRQRPATASGITFCSLEDETGIANLVVRANIWERYRVVTRASPAWIAQGVLERKEGVIHIVMDRVEDLSKRLGEVRTASRNFR